MPVAPLWSMLFFFMMLTLGFSSQFSIVECVFVALMDQFPRQLRSTPNRPIIFRGVTILIYFLISLPMVCEVRFVFLLFQFQTKNDYYILLLHGRYFCRADFTCLISWIHTQEVRLALSLDCLNSLLSFGFTVRTALQQILSFSSSTSEPHLLNTTEQLYFCKTCIATVLVQALVQIYDS